MSPGRIIEAATGVDEGHLSTGSSAKSTPLTAAPPPPPENGRKYSIQRRLLPDLADERGEGLFVEAGGRFREGCDGRQVLWRRRGAQVA